jgi:hypothetical protein
MYTYRYVMRRALAFLQINQPNGRAGVCDHGRAACEKSICGAHANQIAKRFRYVRRSEIATIPVATVRLHLWQSPTWCNAAVHPGIVLRHA